MQFKYLEKKLPDAYKLIIIALVITAILNGTAFGYDKVILSMILAVAVAQVSDIVFTYFKTKKIIYSNSATITALILVNIITPGQFLLLGTTSLAAMILKHLIRFEKKPIFNPAASAMFVIPLFFAWAGFSSNPIESYIGWGNSTIQNVLGTVAILVLGLLVAVRIRRLTASIVYLAAYIIMTLLTVGAAGLQVYLPFFGAFFMVTEPRTSPAKTSHQVIFGIAPWVLGSAYLMLNLSIFHAFSLSFLSANVIKIGLEKSNI